LDRTDAIVEDAKVFSSSSSLIVAVVAVSVKLVRVESMLLFTPAIPMPPLLRDLRARPTDDDLVAAAVGPALAFVFNSMSELLTSESTPPAAAAIPAPAFAVVPQDVGASECVSECDSVSSFGLVKS
jgi:hypothetical protein